MSEPYTVEFNGECMGDLIEPGTILHAIPGAEIRPLDLVSVLLADFTGPWARFVDSISGDGYAGLVKIFLGTYEANGEQVCLLGQLNPPTIAPIPMSAIAGIHLIDLVRQCNGADLQALNLLAPFAGIGMSQKKAA
ncbi:hypothetical protein [Sinorhizobium meliloti]|uniref:hypothetical protein n=1 Tax=Rhizobium meliloti TaxID=382 RepID=UPI00067F1D02|nr:hypothetical protein [Sinorhizobium meliloti]MDE4620636.1 hypothetical protein [Sinorhizobium meliloti]